VTVHAAIVRANVPAGVNETRIKNLNEQIVPMISAAPGFVAGYWCDAIDDKAMAIVVFADEASAKSAAPPVGTDMGAGVTIESVEFRAVLANA
jgi:hypothetical protein